MITAATEPGSTVRGERRLEARWIGKAAAAGRRAFAAAIAVGIRNPVELRRERPEALLVGHHLRGESHREIGAAVEAVLEAEDRLASGEAPRDFDRVLDRLRAAVDEERPFVVGAGGDPVDPLGQLDVGLVGGDGEADVGEAVELLAHRLRRRAG